jgi:hypothetical protein
MQKVIVIVSAVVVLAVSFGAYQLWRTGPEMGRIESRAAVGSVVPASSSGAPRDTAPSAVAPELPAVEPSVTARAIEEPELTADEVSPFGHAVDRQPELETPQDVSGAAAPTDDQPTNARSEAAALEEARATLQGLLRDPDPAVRDEAAELLELLDAGPE